MKEACGTEKGPGTQSRVSVSLHFVEDSGQAWKELRRLREETMFERGDLECFSVLPST